MCSARVTAHAAAAGQLSPHAHTHTHGHAHVPQVERCCDAFRSFYLGTHSGRNALSTRLGQLGVELEEAALNDVFKRFKNLADRKKVSGGGWVGWLLLRLVQSV